MSKKLIGILVFIFVIAALIGVFIASKISKNKSLSEGFVNSIRETIGNTRPNTEEATYKDESGFSFQYYSDLIAADVTPPDPAFYSEVKVEGGGESLFVTIMDTNYKAIDAWLAQSKYNNATLSGATSLSGISAKQYSTSGSFLTIAIDQGVLYMIEGQNISERSESIYDLLVDSFSIGIKAKSGGAVENIIYEEEEIVE